MVFEMEFSSQVPIQIRRSGRDNADGIDYSMSQWYPKICEYDYQGWHANPYVAREFYGVWGDFDVKISIDRKYCLGASGILQNGGNIGWGYEPEGTAVRPEKGTSSLGIGRPKTSTTSLGPLTGTISISCIAEKMGWSFISYTKMMQIPCPTWEAAPKQMDKAFDFVNKNFGQYPYKSYAFLEAATVAWNTQWPLSWQQVLALEPLFTNPFTLGTMACLEPTKASMPGWTKALRST